MSEKRKHFYEFGLFCLDTTERSLFREGRAVALTPKAYETLVLLVEHSGRLLTKDELMRAIWPDTFVEEANLAHNISLLRKALGESPGEQRYILTVPRRGYRFIADVRKLEDGDSKSVEPLPLPVAAPDTKEPLQLRTSSRRLTRLGIPSTRALIILAAVAIVVIGTTAAYWLFRGSDPVPHFRTFAVLPFKPLASTDRDESLEMGMADTLIAKLGSVSDISVRPVSAVRKYTGLDQDPIAAGEELKVDAVLDGNIQRVGDRVRMTVRLVSVRDARPLWAESFDEKFTDIFAVQDAIAQRVVAALALKLNSEKTGRLAKHYTEDAEAYQLYLKGQYFWNKFTPDGSTMAVEYFNQAIARDPGYALAYVGLANSYGAKGINGWSPPKDVFPKAKAAARKALEIDDTLSEAHAAFGATEMFYEWDWSVAERELRRAIELNPSDPNARRLYSYFLTAAGRFDEAIAQAELNQRELDPLSLISYADMVRAFYFARRYDEALAANRKAIGMDPNFAITHLVAGAAYEQKGMYDDAVSELGKANNFPGRLPEALGALGHIYAVSGHRSEALKTLKELKMMSEGRYVSPLDFAILDIGLGDKDAALEQLEKAATDRASWLINLQVEPRFVVLHSEARYTNLIHRVGLGH